MIEFNFKKVLNNVVLIIFSQQASGVINFVQVIVLTRYFGVNDYGILTTIRALPDTIVFLTELGVNSIMLRLIASSKDRVENIFPRVFQLKIGLSIFYYIVLFIIIKISNYELEVKYYIIFSSTTVLLGSYNQLVMAVYRAKENFIYESVVSIIQSGLSLIVIVIAVIGKYQILGVVVGQLIANIILSLFVYRKLFKIYIINFIRIDYRDHIDLIKSSAPFALLGLVSPLFLNIDIIMLSRLSNYESVGLYNAAYRIILFLFVIPFALKRVLFPNLARLYNYKNTNNASFENIFFNAYKITILLGFPISVGIYLLSDGIIHLLFSGKFGGSVVPLKYFAIILIFNFIRSVYSVALYSSKFEKQAVLILAAGTLVNIILDFILIPKYNIEGACIASLISEFVICFTTYFYVRKYIFKPKFLYNTYRIFVSSIIMGICVLIVSDINIIVKICIGIVTYIIAIYLLNVFSKEERIFMYNSIGINK